MRLTSVVSAVFALLLLGTGSASEYWEYLCHDNGDGTWTQVYVPELVDYQAHESHAGDIHHLLVYDIATEDLSDPPVVFIDPKNMDTLEREDTWARGCGPDEWAIDDEDPEFNQPVDPEGTPDDPIAVSDPVGYNDPPVQESGSEDIATVTQLPDTGVGSPSEQNGFLLGAVIASLIFLLVGLWSATKGRR